MPVSQGRSPSGRGTFAPAGLVFDEVQQVHHHDRGRLTEVQRRPGLRDDLAGIPGIGVA
jgi:hypothetical protein